MIKQGKTYKDLLSIVIELGEASLSEIKSELEFSLKKEVEVKPIALQLFSMVQSGVLKYSEKVGPKGGHVYCLGHVRPKKKISFKIKTNENNN